MRWRVIASFLAAGALMMAGDAGRGAQLIRDLNCVNCHRVQGQTLAEGTQKLVTANPDVTDLARSLVPLYTPAALASVLWNHTPEMWEDMSTYSVPRPLASEAEWEHVFAYLSSLQKKHVPSENEPALGNAALGEKTFEQKRCTVCHVNPRTAKAVSPRPNKVFTPYSMVALGWGPGRTMHQKMREKRVKWPYLSPEDMSNLVAYLNTL